MLFFSSSYCKDLYTSYNEWPLFIVFNPFSFIHFFLCIKKMIFLFFYEMSWSYLTENVIAYLIVLTTSSNAGAAFPTSALFWSFLVSLEGQHGAAPGYCVITTLALNYEWFWWIWEDFKVVIHLQWREKINSVAIF